MATRANSGPCAWKLTTNSASDSASHDASVRITQSHDVIHGLLRQDGIHTRELPADAFLGRSKNMRASATLLTAVRVAYTVNDALGPV